MSYELHFENHPEPVVVASGYGFKAPKAWGKMVRPAPEVEAVGESLTLDIGRNPLRELDRRIQEEQERLTRVVEENRAEMQAIQNSIAQLDIRALTASGIQRQEMISSARVLKTRELEEVKNKTLIETEQQRVRVEGLRQLRSQKRKDLSE